MEWNVLELPDVGGVAVERLVVEFTVPQRVEHTVAGIGLRHRLGCRFRGGEIGEQFELGAHTQKAPCLCRLRGWGGRARAYSPAASAR